MPDREALKTAGRDLLGRIDGVMGRVDWDNFMELSRMGLRDVGPFPSPTLDRAMLRLGDRAFKAGVMIPSAHLQ